jgi:hypothetical protein
MAAVISLTFVLTHLTQQQEEHEGLRKSYDGEACGPSDDLPPRSSLPPPPTLPDMARQTRRP